MTANTRRGSWCALGLVAAVVLGSSGLARAQDDSNPAQGRPGCTGVELKLGQTISTDGKSGSVTNEVSFTFTTDTSATPGGLWSRFVDWLLGGPNGNNNGGGSGGGNTGGGDQGGGNQGGGNAGDQGGGNNEGGDAGGSKDGGDTGGGQPASGGGGSGGDSSTAQGQGVKGSPGSLRSMRALVNRGDVTSVTLDEKTHTVMVKFDPSKPRVTEMKLIDGASPLDPATARALGLSGRWGIAEGTHTSQGSTLKVRLVKLPPTPERDRAAAKKSKGARPNAAGLKKAASPRGPNQTKAATSRPRA